VSRPRRPPAYEAHELFFRIGMVERQRAAEQLANLGLTWTQAHTLRVLEPGEPRPMNEAASDVPTDTSTFTGVIDRLQARGLVTRTASPDDRRVKLVALTRNGTTLRQRLLAVMTEPPEALLALSIADQRKLRDILRKAAESIPASPLAAPAESHRARRGRETAT
jgi:DNA-binding MarR family transcriptional regulator